MFPAIQRPGSLEDVITSLQAVIKFLVPFETQQLWKPLPLQGDWTRFDTLHATASYVLDPLGRVEMTGSVYSDAGGFFTIGQLPLGQRPLTKKRFACAQVTAAATCVVDVFPTGVVQLSTVLAAKSAISLDGIRFDTRV